MNTANKILIAIPTNGLVDGRTSNFASLLSQRPDVDYITVIGRPTDYSCNSAVRIFLGHKVYTHLFFLDSDIVPPLDVLDRLLALDEDLASGCYAVAMPSGLRWALSNRNQEGKYILLPDLLSEQSPFYVDGGGAGCLLIKRNVLDRLSWPWFCWIEYPDGNQISEDIFFFQRCNEIGARLKVDPQVRCHHYKITDLTSLLQARIKQPLTNQ